MPVSGDLRYVVAALHRRAYVSTLSRAGREDRGPGRQVARGLASVMCHHQSCINL